MASKYETFERAFDNLIDEAPLDFLGTGSSTGAELDHKEFMGKVEKLKNLVRELLK